MNGSRCVLGVEWGDCPWRRLGWGLLFVKWAHTEMAKPHHPPAVRWALCVQVGWVISWASAIRHTCRVKGNLFLTHLLSLSYVPVIFPSVSKISFKTMANLKDWTAPAYTKHTFKVRLSIQFTNQIMQMRECKHAHKITIERNLWATFINIQLENIESWIKRQLTQSVMLHHHT